jgi:ATP-binding protein involved in chromosome partitioning
MPLKILQENSGLTAIRKIVGIAAGKGGVGKSTVTVNLAHALKKLGFRVGVLDADVYGPSIRKMLPEDELPIEKDSLFYPASSHGIPVISMAYFRKVNEAAAVRAPIATSVINQFLHNIHWGPLDYLLIDFPPGTGDIPLTLCQKGKLCGIVMVTTPQEVALIDVRKAIHLFQEVQIPILGIVENMSYYLHPGTNEKIHLFGKGGGKTLAETMKVPYLAEIAVDPMICQYAEEGKVLNHETSSGQTFHQLALNLTTFS